MDALFSSFGVQQTLLFLHWKIVGLWDTMDPHCSAEIFKIGDELLFEEIRKSVPSSQVLSEGTNLWGKGKQGGRFLGGITGAPA